MNRPFLIRILPDRLRISAWSRLYRSKRNDWLSLYKAASLRHAPSVSMELLPGDHISDCIAFTGVYEPALTRRLVGLAQKGGTLVDVGANLGYFTLLWAANNPVNKCVSFEASPRNIDILCRNVNRSRLTQQIQVVPSAAASAPGKLQFDIGPVEQTGWGGLTLTQSDRSIEVDVVRVDEVITSNDPIEILKVDVEGADVWALMGCERLLKSGAVRQIWYEQNKPRMAALGIPLEAPQEYLRSVGYTATPQNDVNDDLVNWSGVRKSR